jgi:hypothetical protein
VLLIDIKKETAIQKANIYTHPKKKSQQLLFRRGQYFWAPYDKTFVLLNKYHSGHHIEEEVEGIMWIARERRENERRVLGGKT